MTHPRAAQIEAVVAGVMAQALRDSGAGAIMVVEPDAPEGRWLLDACGRHGVPAKPAPAPAAGIAELLGGDHAAASAAARAAADAAVRRDNLLLAHPVNRTALLLGPVPAAPLLPFGDVPAAVVERQQGGWSGPAHTRALADAAGGVEQLDAVLHRWLDRRETFEAAAAGLPAAVAQELRDAIRSGRFVRRRAGLVPKLGYRTIGHDLQF